MSQETTDPPTHVQTTAARLGAAALVASLALGVVDPLSPALTSVARADDDSSMSTYERRKNDMQRRKELLAKTRVKSSVGFGGPEHLYLFHFLNVFQHYIYKGNWPSLQPAGA